MITSATDLLRARLDKKARRRLGEAERIKQAGTKDAWPPYKLSAATFSSAIRWTFARNSLGRPSSAIDAQSDSSCAHPPTRLPCEPPTSFVATIGKGKSPRIAPKTDPSWNGQCCSSLLDDLHLRPTFKGRVSHQVHFCINFRISLRSVIVLSEGLHLPSPGSPRIFLQVFF